MINWILENYNTILSPAIGGIVGWIAGSKTRRIDELKAYQQMYEQFISDYTKRYNELHEEFEVLKKKVDDMEEENKKLKKKVEELEEENNKLKKEIK